jgi:hypothetical protein
MYLHTSGNPFQYYLVIGPRPEVIEKIRLRCNPEHGLVPRITAITCETAADAENLVPLPDRPVSAEEQAWIRSHTILPNSPRLKQIVTEIRRAHRM